MKPIGTPPNTDNPAVLAAWSIVQGRDRSPAQLARLKALAPQAPEEFQDLMGGFIEAFIVSI